MALTRQTIWFYNLRVGRAPAQVRREMQAILGTGPALLGLCEATGYRLPKIEGYRLIRSRKTAGRANVAAYVKNNAASHVMWHPMKETWQKTEHPGVHPAREWLEFRYHEVAVIVGHQPPKYTNNTIRAQQEGIDFLTKRMGPWHRDGWDRFTDKQKEASKARPRVVIMDANRGPHEEGPGPKELARNIDGKIVGTAIDLGVFRCAETANAAYPKTVDGVPLLTDHGHGFKFDLLVDERWV